MSTHAYVRITLGAEDGWVVELLAHLHCLAARPSVRTFSDSVRPRRSASATTAPVERKSL